MRGMKKLVVIAVIVVSVLLGWQAGNSAFADLELQGDMHDMASALGSTWGYQKYHTDDDFREAVIHKASDYGIHLEPDQVKVVRVGEGAGTLYLAADYSVPVSVGSYTMVLHFTPSSTKSYF